MTHMAPIPPRAEPATPSQAALPAYDVRALTGPAGLAQLILDGQSYSLRITRAGKLILTK